MPRTFPQGPAPGVPRPARIRWRTSRAGRPVARPRWPRLRAGELPAGGSPARSPRRCPAGGGLLPKLLEPLDRVLEALLPLAEREPDVRPAVLGVVVEEGRGDRRDADLVDQVPAEAHVVLETEHAEVGADKISAGGHRYFEADPPQRFDEVVSLGLVVGAELRVVPLGSFEGGGGAVLERCRRRKRDELVDSAK